MDIFGWYKRCNAHEGSRGINFYCMRHEGHSGNHIAYNGPRQGGIEWGFSIPPQAELEKMGERMAEEIKLCGAYPPGAGFIFPVDYPCTLPTGHEGDHINRQGIHENDANGNPKIVMKTFAQRPQSFPDPALDSDEWDEHSLPNFPSVIKYNKMQARRRRERKVQSIGHEEKNCGKRTAFGYRKPKRYHYRLHTCGLPQGHRGHHVCGVTCYNPHWRLKTACRFMF